MKSRSVTIWLTVVFCGLLPHHFSKAFGDLIYSDGQVHNISTDYSGNVGHIYDSGSGKPTTVNIYTGGVYDELYAWDYSAINFFDGTINQVLGARNYSLLKVYDGWIGKIMVNHGTGGGGNARVDIFGGSVVELVPYDGECHISGGSIAHLVTNYSPWVSVTGGSIGHITSYLQSQIEITGGYIGDMIVHDESVIIISGTGFNYDYGPIDATFGTLQGTLANGDTINADFYRYASTAEIILTPEPATFLLLGLGGLLLRRKY